MYRTPFMSIVEARIALSFLRPDLTSEIVAIISPILSTSQYAMMEDGSIVGLLTGNHFAPTHAMLNRFLPEMCY